MSGDVVSARSHALFSHYREVRIKERYYDDDTCLYPTYQPSEVVGLLGQNPALGKGESDLPARRTELRTVRDGEWP